jgi:putative ABC transport system ATP-binding protein
VKENILIEIESISKAYRKGPLKIPALNNISFTVPKGGFISIVGRSGSGKSTLLNLVGGLDHSEEGQILFNGRDLGSMSRRERTLHRRHNVGMVFQSFNLIPYRNALENVTLALTFGRVPRKERKNRAVELLTRVGLSHRRLEPE